EFATASLIRRCRASIRLFTRVVAVRVKWYIRARRFGATPPDNLLFSSQETKHEKVHQCRNTLGHIASESHRGSVTDAYSFLSQRNAGACSYPRRDQRQGCARHRRAPNGCVPGAEKNYR